MALTPTITLCLNSGCTTLTLRETTGAYNASTNTGGYGAPNPEIAAVTAAVLTVTDPDGTEYEIDLFTEGFPTDNEDFEYEIDLADLGDRESIEDGYWQFSYTVTSGDDYTGTKNYFFYCNIECCVNRLLTLVEADECLCDEVNNKNIDNYIKAKTFLESLKNAANCYNETNFNRIKTLLDKLCRNSGCRTCN